MQINFKYNNIEEKGLEYISKGINILINLTNFKLNI